MSYATIYSFDGYTINDGLQSALVCDAALIEARCEAKQRNKPVIVEDRGTREVYMVMPDGEVEDASEDFEAPDYDLDD
jgi:hypothetical protein